MKKFNRTTPAPDGHTHLAYINENQGYFLTSEDLGHAHEGQWVPEQPEQPEQQDPETGEIIPGIPYQPGFWQWTPGPDGHVHEDFVPLQIKSQEKKKEEEADVIAETLQLFKAGYELESDCIDAGRESEKFRAGIQWDSQTESMLAKNNRACLTINHIGNLLDTLSGHERQERTELRLVPQEGGDQKVADMYNVLIKHLLDRCNFWLEKSQAFEDQITTGKFCYNITVSQDEDLRGDIVVERFPWDQAGFGPHEKNDGSDADYLWKYKWYSLATFKQRWPEHAEAIEQSIGLHNELPSEIDITEPGNEDRNASNFNFNLTTMLDVQRKNILVIEVQRRIYTSVPVIANRAEDFYLAAIGWSKEDLEAASSIPGFVKVTREIKKIRITKVGGGILLSDENPAELPSDKFHTIIGYAQRQRGRYWGKVEQVKDIQRVINKSASLGVDIMSRMSAPIWFFDNQVFPGNEAEKFLDSSSEPGAAFEVNNTNHLPVAKDGAAFPVPLVNFMQHHTQNLVDMMNITPTPGGANESGSALLQKQKLKLTGNEFLFDNQTLAITQIGKLLIPIIQKYYTPARIIRILRNENAKNPMIWGEEQLSSFTNEQIEEMLKANEIEKFDLVVAESTFSPSVRLGNYLLLADLMAKGVDIPLQVLLKYADMTDEDRKEALAAISQQNETQALEAQKTNDVEVEKTLVGKGIIPQSVRDRFQLEQDLPVNLGGGIAEGSLVEPSPQPSAPPPPSPMPPISINVQNPPVSMPALTIQVDGKRPGRRLAQVIRNEDGSIAGADFQEIPE